jgi:hypothetical protein
MQRRPSLLAAVVATRANNLTTPARYRRGEIGGPAVRRSLRWGWEVTHEVIGHC